MVAPAAASATGRAELKRYGPSMVAICQWSRSSSCRVQRETRMLRLSSHWVPRRPARAFKRRPECGTAQKDGMSPTHARFRSASSPFAQDTAHLSRSAISSCMSRDADCGAGPYSSGTRAGARVTAHRPALSSSMTGDGRGQCDREILGRYGTQEKLRFRHKTGLQIERLAITVCALVTRTIARFASS